MGLADVVHPFNTLFAHRNECGHYAEVQDKLHTKMEVVGDCVFWTQGVASLAAAVFGLMGNAISIWVLSVPEMRANAFNRLLLALAIVDCLFIVPGVVVYTAKAFDWWQSDAYNYAFPVFLYPFSEMALCSSIFMTVAIAVERYIGLCRPLQRLSGRGPYSAKCYIFPVLLLAFLLNVPKFFESETVVVADPRFNSSSSRIKITELRMDPHYITYYTMWTRLLATGVIPLLVLALLNSKIYLSIRQSKQQLRILAIRSALPMAILGQSAPTVPPLSDLIGSTATAAAGGDLDKEAARSRTRGDGNNSIATVSPLLRRQEAALSGGGTGREEKGGHGSKEAFRNGSPKSFQQQGRNGYHAVQPVISSQSNAGGGNVGSEAQGESSPSKGTPTRRQHANGQMRHIQRSVSAFEPTLKRTLRIKDAHILRSNSTTVATAATTAATAASSSNVIALTSQWQQGVAGGAGAAAADIKLAPILFGVVIVFILCNSLRVLLNIYDFTVVEDIIDCHKKGVGRYPPTWVMCSISVSHLLLIVNSSVNFLVYCVAGTRFRRILFRKLRILAKATADFGCCGGRGRGAASTSSSTKKSTSLTKTAGDKNRTTVLAAKFLAQKQQEEVLQEEDEEEEGDEEEDAAENVAKQDVEGGQEEPDAIGRDALKKSPVNGCSSDDDEMSRIRLWDEKRERWKKTKNETPL